MRAAAPLAFALRSLEADHGRKLGPVDGIEPSIAGMDRHQGSALVVCVRKQPGPPLLLDATLLVRVVPTMADCIDAALAGLHPPSFSAARARRSLPQNRSPSRGTKKACETLSRPSPFTRAGLDGLGEAPRGRCFVSGGRTQPVDWALAFETISETRPWPASKAHPTRAKAKLNPGDDARPGTPGSGEKPGMP